MEAQQRTLVAVLAALGSLFAGAAHAEIAIHAAETTLLDVQNVPEAAGAARAISGPPLGTATFASSRIAGVFPSGSDLSTASPRGFFVQDPQRREVPINSGRFQALVQVIPASGLQWVEPYDVNDSSLVVGQAQDTFSIRYAFTAAGGGSVTALPGLKDASRWAESRATAVSGVRRDSAGTPLPNSRPVTVVGWKKAVNGSEQAFYWTDGNSETLNIPIANANSKALSVNNRGAVAGYYNTQSGSATEHLGFVFDIGSGALAEIGPVVVPAVTPWFDEFRNVSINSAGAVAATHEVTSGSETVNQAFLLQGGKTVPIGPPPGGEFEETFAAGISDTGWVVGILHDEQHAVVDSGFLWFGGKTLDLSEDVALPTEWKRITAVYDVFSATTADKRYQIGTIVGKGLYLEPGATIPVQRAFAMQITLQVPEPHTYLLLGVGLLAIGAIRVRRRPPHQE